MAPASQTPVEAEVASNIVCAFCVALLAPVLPNTVSGSWTGTAEGGSGGGCTIATAAYGSYLDPHVHSLRRFRDETLMRSQVGRMLIAWYYEYRRRSRPTSRLSKPRKRRHGAC